MTHIQQNKPNFLRIEALTYRNRGESEETVWKLIHLTTSEMEARAMLAKSDYFLRVVECTSKHGRLVVDSNDPKVWH